MMWKAPGTIVLLIAVLAAMTVAAPSPKERFEAAPAGAHRWVRSPVIVSLSSSLSSPPPNLKAGSDVTGALRRALQSWTAIAGVQFFEVATTAESISPPNAGDGVNLITVSTANASSFESSDAPARTRVFFDAGGAIVEADIALNPAVQFSTDGTRGTYDLESTFAHEIGHLIGLEHSAVIGATMQPRQARNGTYGLPAFSQRSLSEDDAAQARALYGLAGAAITGRVMTNVSGRARSIFAAHFFAEDVATGRVVASSISSTSGQYRIDGLRAGVYRVFGQPLDGPVHAMDFGANFSAGAADMTTLFRSFIGSNSTPTQSVNVGANSSLKLGFLVFPATPTLTPRLIGMNSELSNAALPLQAGGTFTIYIAGEGIEDVAIDGISFSSRALHPVSDSLREVAFDVPYGVIAFDVAVGDQIQPGDYTIRLQSRNGELAFLPGAITIESK